MLLKDQVREVGVVWEIDKNRKGFLFVDQLQEQMDTGVM
jgi:hypothetical protein